MDDQSIICDICKKDYPVEDGETCEVCMEPSCPNCLVSCQIESVEHEMCVRCQSGCCGVCTLVFCDEHWSGSGCADCDNPTCYVHPAFHCEICSYETASCCGTECHKCHISVDSQCFICCESCNQNTCLNCVTGCNKCCKTGLCICLQHICEGV